MARTRDFHTEIKKAQEALKAAGVEERRSLADPETPGLQIRITRRSAVWVFRYRSGGTQRRLKLGTWRPDGGMTVALARKRASTERLKVENGRDPAIEKQKAKEEAERAQRDSIQMLVTEYVERHAKPKKRTWRQDDLILKREVLPHWKTRAASSITGREVYELVRAVADRGTGTYGARVLAIIRRMFRFGIQTHLLDHNPARDIESVAPEPVQEREYSADDLKTFWANTATLAVPHRAMLRICLLTGVRRSEAANMRWADIVEHWWTLPGTATKNRQAHRVYLTDTARAELKQIIRAQDDVYVFERHRAGRELTSANKHAFANMEARDKPRHALRRNIATELEAMGYGLEVIKAVLNHVPGGGVTKRYALYVYDREKVQALKAWERRLLGIVEGKDTDTVVPFTKTRRNRAARPAGR